MSADTPVVSVIVPARNAAATIGRQLGALSRQRAPFGWELIVCDNGSTDGTGDVALGWSDRLPHLRVVDASARRGAGAARNAGARAAVAPLLLFCDADDEVGDGWLTAMVSALDGAHIVAGARRYDRVNRDAFGPDDWTAPLFTLASFPALPAASGNNLGVRAAVFDEVGGFDEALRTGEDVDLCWRVQLAGYRLVGESKAIVDIRRRTGMLAVFRQFFGYGLGDAALARKHVELLAPTTADDQPATGPTDPVAAAAARLHRAFARLARGRAPMNPTFAAARLGRRLGRARGGLR